MDFQTQITKTLQPPVIPAVLQLFTDGAIIVAACFERSETLDSSEPYEDEDSYDSYWVFKFSDSKVLPLAYENARQCYENLLTKDNLVTASICVTLDSTD